MAIVVAVTPLRWLEWFAPRLGSNLLAFLFIDVVVSGSSRSIPHRWCPMRGTFTVQFAVTFPLRQAAPHAVRLAGGECIFAARVQYRTLSTQCLCGLFTLIPCLSAFLAVREEHADISAETTCMG